MSKSLFVSPKTSKIIAPEAVPASRMPIVAICPCANLEPANHRPRNPLILSPLKRFQHPDPRASNSRLGTSRIETRTAKSIVCHRGALFDPAGRTPGHALLVRIGFAETLFAPGAQSADGDLAPAAQRLVTKLPTQPKIIFVQTATPRALPNLRGHENNSGVNRRTESRSG
jgi:hypothetical protein